MALALRRATSKPAGYAILGPTSTWLYRRLAMGLLVEEEFEVDLVDLAVSLGLGEGMGKQSPMARAIQRLIRFGAAEAHCQRLLVRRALAPSDDGSTVSPESVFVSSPPALDGLVVTSVASGLHRGRRAALSPSVQTQSFADSPRNRAEPNVIFGTTPVEQNLQEP